MSFEPSALIGHPDFEARIHAENPFHGHDTKRKRWADHAICSGCEICTNIFDDLDPKEQEAHPVDASSLTISSAA